MPESQAPGGRKSAGKTTKAKASKDNAKSATPAKQAADSPDYRARPCPICRAMAVKAFHPFCSKRCADVDLHRWLAGSYRIPVVDEAPDENELGGGEDGPNR